MLLPIANFKRRKICSFQIVLSFAIIVIIIWIMVIGYYASESDITRMVTRKWYQQIKLDAPKLDATSTSTTEKSPQHAKKIEFAVSKSRPKASTFEKCYQHSEMVELDASIELFEDVLLSDRQPQIDKTMFFVETNCSADHLVKLNARQACAIESAARTNPNWDIFVLFASPVGFAKDSSLHSSLSNVLKAYPNVHMRNVHMWTYATDTPFQEWMNEGELFESKYFVVHTSDCLRLMSLYRFGGIYFDLDVVVQKSFENVEPNFIGSQSENELAIGIMSFTHTGIGHEIASRCARDFVSNFNGTLWAHNGPAVIARVLERLCKTKNALEMTRERCSGFKVYPPNEFYAVHYSNWMQFFDSNFTNTTLALTEDSLAIHVWNKMSSKKRVSKNAAYGIIAKENCPNVYAMSEDSF